MSWPVLKLCASCRRIKTWSPPPRLQAWDILVFTSSVHPYHLSTLVLLHFDSQFTSTEPSTTHTSPWHPRLLSSSYAYPTSRHYPTTPHIHPDCAFCRMKRARLSPTNLLTMTSLVLDVRPHQTARPGREEGHRSCWRNGRLVSVRSLSQ